MEFVEGGGGTVGDEGGEERGDGLAGAAGGGCEQEEQEGGGGGGGEEEGVEVGRAAEGGKVSVVRGGADGETDGACLVLGGREFDLGIQVEVGGELRRGV